MVKDMRDALATWATLPLVTILPEHKSMMVVLLNNMIDLASIMGFPRVITSAQKCMFELLEPTKRKKNLARLWEWRRISHAMCACPVNKIFIDVLSKYCGEASRGVDFWIDSLEEPALIVGWKHNLSYTFADLCCSKPNLNSTDLKSFHGGVTIGEAAATVSCLLTFALSFSSHLLYEKLTRKKKNSLFLIGFCRYYGRRLQYRRSL